MIACTRKEHAHECVEVGDFSWRQVKDMGRHLLIVLPDLQDGRGKERHMLPIRPAKNPSQDSWHWDGNEDAPTLSPSINRNNEFSNGLLWHGHLIEGQLI